MRGNHRNRFEQQEDGVWSIRTDPAFGIAQRAFLVGDLLWDCITLLDEETVERVMQMGGISRIAISHPHYYATMAEWSRKFGDVPVYIHEADREWVRGPAANVVYWRGAAQSIGHGLTLVHCGGHFDGFQVLHWDRGALFAGDQPQVAMDRKSVSFLYSYPNMIPLGPGAVRRIVERLGPYEFDRLYGAFEGRTLQSGAKDIVRWSAERYLRFIKE
jgi:hypothetical protein